MHGAAAALRVDVGGGRVGVVEGGTEAGGAPGAGATVGFVKVARSELERVRASGRTGAVFSLSIGIACSLLSLSTLLPAGEAKGPSFAVTDDIETSPDSSSSSW